jgi:dimethylhistidine N-methyltransferase
MDSTANDSLAEHVDSGLSATQKYLASGWLYDDEGSRLFQRIMTLPEYYLTRVELELLRERGADIAHCIAPRSEAVDLIELGSGDGRKTLALCETLQNRGVECVYHPIDLSSLVLQELLRRFTHHLPELPVLPCSVDYFQDWPRTASYRRQVVMLLGSNLGNFDENESNTLFQRIHSRLRKGDLLLLGLDLQKDPEIILAAYNDRDGVTARFNLNLLRRLNRELGMNFALDQFRHYATYNPLDGTARSFLVSQRHQHVHSRVLRRDFAFQTGETIYMEQSQKYTRSMIERMAARNGFAVQRQLTDSRGWYTLAALLAV